MGRHSLKKETIKKDNPHFIGNDMNFDYYRQGKHWCCDVTSAAIAPDGRKCQAKASYEFFNDKWVLIANQQKGVNKIKQFELAKAAGITEAMLSYILSGERRPSWDVAKKLAELTSTDPLLWMEYNAIEMRKAVKNAKQAA